VLILYEFANRVVLPFTTQTAATAKLCEVEIVDISTETVHLADELFFCGINKRDIVIFHTEVNLVDNLKEINLKLHYREERAIYLKMKTVICVSIASNISAEGSPKTEELNIVGLDKTEGAKIFKLFIGEGESAEVVNLCIDFLNHFIGKFHIIVATLEDILAVDISMLVEHYLVHIKFIEVSIKK
jgi:hypothetical protein